MRTTIFIILSAIVLFNTGCRKKSCNPGNYYIQDKYKEWIFYDLNDQINFVNDSAVQITVTITESEIKTDGYTMNFENDRHEPCDEKIVYYYETYYCKTDVGAFILKMHSRPFDFFEINESQLFVDNDLDTITVQGVFYDDIIHSNDEKNIVSKEYGVIRYFNNSDSTLWERVE